MTEAETESAAKALQAWFESQDITPGDAGGIMSVLLAHLLTAKTKNVASLQDSVNIFRAMLTCDIALRLR